jgi:hypothetical protein
MSKVLVEKNFKPSAGTSGKLHIHLGHFDKWQSDESELKCRIEVHLAK